MNWNLFEICLDKPLEALIKTGACIGIGTGIDMVEASFIPVWLMEFAKLLAYFGASVAFFKFLINIFKKKEVKNETCEKCGRY